MTESNKIYKVSDGAIDVLNDLIWHDSVMQDIRLIRTNSLDQVILKINLIIDYNNQISELTELIFHDCLKVTADMSWGVVCMSDGEMIYSGDARRNEVEIEKYLSIWNIDSLKEYGEFKLDLASTGSNLYLIFKALEIKRLGNPEEHNAPEPLGLSPNNK